MTQIDWQHDEHRESAADIDSALERVVGESSKIKRRRRTAVLSSGATAVVVVLAVFATTTGGGTKSPNQVAAPATNVSTPATQIKTLLASDVVVNAQVAAADVKTISGTRTLTVKDEKGDTTEANTWNFRADDQGNTWTRWYQDGGTIEDDAFVASTGVAISYQHNATATSTKNAYGSSQPNQLSGVLPILRLVQSRNNGQLHDSTYQGRPAWKLTYIENSDAAGIYNYEITILKDTYFPVEVDTFTATFDQGGKVTNTYLSSSDTITDLQLNPKFDANAFTVNVPTNIKIDEQDQGYKSTTPAGAASIVGYPAFVPGYLPDGFKLVHLSAYVGNGQDATLGADGLTIPNENVITAQYQSGLQTLTVRTQSVAGVSASRWADPSGGEDIGTSVPKSPVVLRGGAFNTITAQHDYGVDGPDVWAVGAHYVLSISGDASNDDMIKIAESLQPAK